MTGLASEPGSPTWANVAALTDVTSAEYVGSQRVVPFPLPVPVPAATADDRPDAEAEPPVVLMTTMVTRAIMHQADRDQCGQ